MSEDKQCLQRDTTEGRCLEEGCGKNMPDVCFDLTAYETSRWLELQPDRENVARSGTGNITYGQIEYIVMVKAGYECQPESTCRHTVTFATMVCYAEVLFQSSFSLCRSTRCLRNMRLPTRGLRSRLRNGAHRASQNVTVHRLSAYS